MAGILFVLRRMHARIVGHGQTSPAPTRCRSGKDGSAATLRPTCFRRKKPALPDGGAHATSAATFHWGPTRNRSPQTGGSLGDLGTGGTG
jgi:hypothetical protein